MTANAGAEQNTNAAMLSVRTAKLKLKIVGLGHEHELSSTIGESGHLAYIPVATLAVHGHEWQIGYHPYVYPLKKRHQGWVKLRLTLASAAEDDVAASFTCCLVDPSQRLQPCNVVTTSSVFRQGSSAEVPLMPRRKLVPSGYLDDDGCCIVECAVVVLSNSTRLPASAVEQPTNNTTDITFLIAGQSFHAHRWLLAARSKVFRAQFRRWSCPQTAVEIKDMCPDSFRGLLHYIYTDTVPPQLVQASMMTTRRLLDAADRYGMDKLKAICEDIICALAVDVDTVQEAWVLADQYGCAKIKTLCEEKMCDLLATDTVGAAWVLADHHGCAKLKARCMDFLVDTAKYLLCILSIEDCKDLEEIWPTYLDELFRLSCYPMLHQDPITQ